MAQLYSDAFGASQRSGAFVLRSSFQMIQFKSRFSNFGKKYFSDFYLVAISDPENGPIVFPLKLSYRPYKAIIAVPATQWIFVVVV